MIKPIKWLGFKALHMCHTEAPSQTFYKHIHLFNTVTFIKQISSQSIKKLFSMKLCLLASYSWAKSLVKDLFVEDHYQLC